MNTQRPELKVAVVMRRERITGPMSRWQTSRWELAEVVLNEDGFGVEPRLLYQNENEERWLHPACQVELFADDVEGYQLNLSTQAPGWFVLWRMEEEAALAEAPIARPVAVSLSYFDAGRWLDAQETVEQVPAPLAVVQWLQAFVAAHPVAESTRRQRPQSFRPLTDRFGNPAAVSTERKSGGSYG